MFDYPILNLKIVPESFKKGPFENHEDLLKEAKRLENCSFLGDFVLMASGKLKKGYEAGLRVDVTELNPGSNHIHWGTRKVEHLHYHDGSVVMEGFPIKKKYWALPYFTLEKLYGDEKQESKKLGLIKEEFTKHGLEDKFKRVKNSFATKNSTKLKLAENLYRKYIA